MSSSALITGKLLRREFKRIKANKDVVLDISQRRIYKS